MWYVLWTYTGREKKACELIDGSCSDLITRSFVPTRRINIKRAGEWTTETKALFPGYLFVDSQKITDLALKIRSLKGFNKILDSDEEYLPLTDEENIFIDKLYDDGGMFDTSVGIIDGDQIKITSGPLFGMEGNIRKIDRHKREAYVEITMFGQKKIISVGLEIIEKT